MSLPLLFNVLGEPAPQPRPSAAARIIPGKFDKRGQPLVRAVTHDKQWHRNAAGVRVEHPVYPWRRAVRAAFLVAVGWPSTWRPITLDVRLKVGLWFRFSRPADHYRANGDLKEWAWDVEPTAAGDLDNLAKCIDELTHRDLDLDDDPKKYRLGLWVDDRQIRRLFVDARYVGPGEAAGCTIKVEEFRRVWSARATQPTLLAAQESA